MDQLTVQFTAPVLSRDALVLFSAYGFGWGYRAFAVPYEVVHERLGAGGMTDQQIRLAFELGKRRVLEAVESCGKLPYEGQRVSLPAERL